MPEPLNERTQFLRALNDQWLQVRTDDGTLLGTVPAPADLASVERLQNTKGQQVPVGWVLMAAVRIERAGGLNPFDLYDFEPAPGVTPESVGLGPLGAPGEKQADPDIGKAV